MKYIQRLIEAGKQYQVQFTAQEAWNEKAIGIDTVHKKVMFLNLKHAPPSEIFIDLVNVTACKLFRQGEIRQGLPDSNAKIELQFTPIQGKNVIPNIPFFDMTMDDPMQMGPSQEKAKAWLDRINACLL
ncbi:MAG: hypothetical protein IPJ74_24380 [Saprospiraceae bacterium]|nr:hypothetical protein [Saprospiraceae bacterium]